METTGVFGEDAMAFVRELGRRTRVVTGDVLAFSRLKQRISACIQRCNAAAVLGSMRDGPNENDADEFY
jgi:hypothetical protein